MFQILVLVMSTLYTKRKNKVSPKAKRIVQVLNLTLRKIEWKNFRSLVWLSGKQNRGLEPGYQKTKQKGGCLKGQ